MRGPEDFSATGTITASSTNVANLPSTAGAQLILNQGCSVVGIQVGSGLTGTILFEASQDNGQSWFAVPVVKSDMTFVPTSGVVNPGATQYIFPAGGYSGLRVRCSAFSSGSAVVELNASAAYAGIAGTYANTFPFALSGTSPSAAGTTVGVSQVGLDTFEKAVVLAVVQGATGGTLDVYLQSTPDGGTTWYDVCHYTQLAAAGAQVAWFVSLTRGETFNATAPVSVNKASGTPTLAANTVVPHGLGNGLRVVYVAGAATSAGAAQTILVLAST